MARARNIKPSFFQNEQLGDLRPIDRLAFIGMWTVADYKGCIEFRPKRLKVQLLPYDNDADFEVIGKNLERSGFISTYSVAGQRYIKIINFEKHQNPHKNEREAGSEIPDITQATDLNTLTINPEQDGTTPADSPFLIPNSLYIEPNGSCPHEHEDEKKKSIPYQKIVELYHQKLPTCPRVEILNPKRKGQIRARWNEGELDSLETWGEFFDFCSHSAFLTNKTDPSPSHPNFRVDLEWLTNASNYTKIVEKRYHNGKA